MSLSVITQTKTPIEDGYTILGYNNEFLFCHKEKLCMYKLKGTEYVREWEKSSPDGMEYYYHKVQVDSSGRILLQKKKNEVTILYDSDLKQQGTYLRRGALLGCTEDGHLMYMRGTGTDDQVIEAYTYGTVGTEYKKITFTPLNRYLTTSVCTVAEKFVMVEPRAKLLDIFSKQGRTS